jgi:hypothetical protein
MFEGPSLRVTKHEAPENKYETAETTQRLARVVAELARLARFARLAWISTGGNRPKNRRGSRGQAKRCPIPPGDGDGAVEHP